MKNVLVTKISLRQYIKTNKYFQPVYFIRTYNMFSGFVVVGDFFLLFLSTILVFISGLFSCFQCLLLAWCVLPGAESGCGGLSDCGNSAAEGTDGCSWVLHEEGQPLHPGGGPETAAGERNGIDWGILSQKLVCYFVAAAGFINVKTVLHMKGLSVCDWLRGYNSNKMKIMSWRKTGGVMVTISSGRLLQSAVVSGSTSRKRKASSGVTFCQRNDLSIDHVFVIFRAIFLSDVPTY